MSAPVTIGGAYYMNGFFNQTREMPWLPKKEDYSNILIVIHCVGHNSNAVISAEIRYKGMNGEGNWINPNHKARIFAKPAESLKKWFKENISEGDKIIFTKNDEKNYTITEMAINNSSIKESSLQDVPTIRISEIDKWNKENDWFWEGNIQQKISDYLISMGYNEVKTVNTHLKDKGPDITGEKDGTKWVIEVKGYPSDKYVQDTDRYTKGESKRTNPSTQARHWFSEALTSILLTKSEDPTKMICLGFPRNGVYVSYLNRISYIRGKLDIYTFLVDENANVKMYHPYQQI
jgi:hypothetical protein